MQKNTLTLIPKAVIHPNQIVLYKESHWEPFKPSKKNYKSEELEYYQGLEEFVNSSRKAEGKVSVHAERKIKKAIQYLLMFAQNKVEISRSTGRQFKFKISFITLTLPSQQIHDDNVIKRECLNQFLIEIQKYHGVTRFIWRAEKQKNGSIHFHIITDKFIFWNDIRNRWNRIVNKLGYVDRHREKMKEYFKNGFKVRTDLEKNWNETKQRKAYRMNLKTGWDNPNSIDVHAVQKIINLQAYFIKYFTKNQKKSNKPETKNQKKSDKPEKEQKEQAQQTGRIWGSSRNLQKISGAQMVIDSHLEEELKELMARSDCKVYSDYYFTVIYVDFHKLRHLRTHSLFDEFSNYLIREFDFYVQLYF